VLQLSGAAARKGLSVDKSLLNRLIDSTSESAAAETELYNELLALATTIKEGLYNVIYIPWLTLSVYTFGASCVVLFILIQYNEGLERFVYNNDFPGFFKELAAILGVYLLMFVQVSI
jgi:hypothetical protein